MAFSIKDLWFNKTRNTPIPLCSIKVIPNQEILSKEVLEDHVQDKIRQTMTSWGGDRWIEKGYGTPHWRVEVYEGEAILGTIPLSLKK